MQKRSVQILLIVSLAFNIAFIGFGVFRYIQMRRFSDPRVMFRHAPQEIKDHFREHREQVDPIRQEIDLIRYQFITELKKPEFNEEQLQEKLNEYLTKQAELERIMGNNFIEMRKKLSPEEMQEFFSHFPKMKTPHQRREKLPQSFRRRHEKAE